MARKPEAVKVLHCGVCGLPAEYCAFGPDFERCKPWLIQNAPRIYANIKDENPTARTSPDKVLDNGTVRLHERVSQTEDSKNIISGAVTRNKDVNPKSKKTTTSASPNKVLDSGTIRLHERVSQTKDSKNITSSTITRNNDVNSKSKKTTTSASANKVLDNGTVRLHERVLQTKDSKNITNSTVISNNGKNKDKVGPKSSINIDGEGMQMSMSIETFDQTIKSFTREKTTEHYGSTHSNVMQGNTGYNNNGSGTQTIGDVKVNVQKTVNVQKIVNVYNNVNVYNFST